MKVKIKKWHAVATWRWDMPEDEVCGICRVQFDGTCPTCKFPGDDCTLRKNNPPQDDAVLTRDSDGQMRAFLSHALPTDLDSTRILERLMPNVPAE